MFAAMVRDVAKDGGFEAVALVDAAWAVEPPPGVRLRQVERGGEIEALAAEATRADAVLVVAPETRGILAHRVAAVRAAGGRPLAASAAFLALAADKQASIDALAAAGVPVPAGRSLASGQGWPDGFSRPAVRKARAAAGCDGLVIVGATGEPPPPDDRPTRLEAFAAGTMVGVSCLCGPRCVRPLPPLRQLFAGDASPSFIGGEPLADARLRDRAERLAQRSIDAIARAAGDGEEPAAALGWVGVDMILGTRDDGRGDRVLEVNPRLTTSFVGHERSCSGSLVRAMLDAAGGRWPEVAVDATRGTFSVADHGICRSTLSARPRV